MESSFHTPVPRRFDLYVAETKKPVARGDVPNRSCICQQGLRVCVRGSSQVAIALEPREWIVQFDFNLIDRVIVQIQFQ